MNVNENGVIRKMTTAEEEEVKREESTAVLFSGMDLERIADVELVLAEILGGKA